MSIDAITYAKGLRVYKPARALLLIIAENTFNDSGECRVGQRVLADESDTPERTLRYHLDRLEADNVIRRRGRWNAAGGRKPDAIEIIGFKSWLDELRRSQGIPATSAGMPSPDTGNVPPVSTGNCLPVPLDESRTNSPVQDSPPTPRGGSREGGLENLIEELRANGKPAQVLAFIARIASSLTISHPDPRSLFSEVCTALAGKPARVLAKAADEVIFGQHRRSKIVSPKNFVDAVALVEPSMRIRITRDSPSFVAWKAHYVAVGKRTYAIYCEGQGHFSELTEWPPGHRANEPGSEAA